jgi:hypothetical protein
MALRELPLELLTHVCQHLGLTDLVRVAATCKRFCHGGPKTMELPTESPVVAVLRELAFPRPELIPSMRPADCSESWVAYLTLCARQRRCREAPPFAVGGEHALYVDASGRLLACGEGAAVGHGDAKVMYPLPTPVAAMTGVRVRSVAAAFTHSFALSWDGQICSSGENKTGQLGHGDKLDRPSPELVEGLEGVCSMAAGSSRSLAATQSGDVFHWGKSFVPGAEDPLSPTVVEGFAGVRVRLVSCCDDMAYAIGEDGEVFSWEVATSGVLFFMAVPQTSPRPSASRSCGAFG